MSRHARTRCELELFDTNAEWDARQMFSCILCALSQCTVIHRHCDGLCRVNKINTCEMVNG